MRHTLPDDWEAQERIVPDRPIWFPSPREPRSSGEVERAWSDVLFEQHLQRIAQVRRDTGMKMLNEASRLHCVGPALCRRCFAQQVRLLKAKCAYMRKRTLGMG